MEKSVLENRVTFREYAGTYRIVTESDTRNVPEFSRERNSISIPACREVRQVRARGDLPLAEAVARAGAGGLHDVQLTRARCGRPRLTHSI